MMATPMALAFECHHADRLRVLHCCFWHGQVSPPQEDIEGSMEWWGRYQPVSYKLCSRSGTEQEFASMVKTCKKFGVNIIVDAVINHMADHGEGKGRCGTVLHSKCDFVGVYSCQDFHHAFLPPCAGGKPHGSLHGMHTPPRLDNCRCVTQPWP